MTQVPNQPYTPPEVPPHGGLWLNPRRRGEICIDATGPSPRFRLYFYDEHGQLRPLPTDTITLEITRPDGRQERFEFARHGTYMESTSDVAAPHQFKACMSSAHGDHVHRFELIFA